MAPLNGINFMDLRKINNLQFSSSEKFERAVLCLDSENIKVVALQPSSYSSGTMVTFRKRIVAFRDVILKYNLRARDENLNKELDHYRLTGCLLGLGT